jgi:hypothetical protein
MADEDALKGLIKEIRAMRRDLDRLKFGRKMSASLRRAARKTPKKAKTQGGDYTVQYTVYADYSDYAVVV